MTDKQLLGLLMMAAGFFMGALLLSMAFHGHTPFVPQCQEDEVVIGRGDFGNDGYWDFYECANRDDIYFELGYNEGFEDGAGGESYGGDF